MAVVSQEAIVNLIENELSQITQHLEEFYSLAGCADQQRGLRDCLRHLSQLETTPKCARLKTALRDLLNGMSAADLFSNERCNISTDGESVFRSVETNEAGGGLAAERISLGSAGRPRINIGNEQLEVLIKQGYSGVQIAEKFKVSRSYIYKRLKSEGLQLRCRYSPLSSEDLQENVHALKKNFPNAGYRVMRGLLKSKGLNVQRDRVRHALRTVDPEGTAERWARAVTRRTYKVAAPNSLWHIDANLKLARYGMAVHGAMDGSSHLVPYLRCLNNKRAASILNLFLQATAVYGIPSRVRSDHGLENVDVAIFMNMVRGRSRSSHITGSSVHNQRIERFWRDVHHQVLKPFKEDFCLLQDGGLLDVDNGGHLMALHVVYMAELNRRLELFRQGWNCHKMSTDPQQRTPHQQWIDGMLQHAESGLTAVDSILGGQTLQETIESLSQGAVHGLEHEDEVQDDDDIQYLSREERSALLRALEETTDLKARYIRAVQILCNGN